MGVTLTLQGAPTQMQPLVIAFAGMPETRSPWITVAPAGAPDTQWGDWAYTKGAGGTVTLLGQRAGAYEIRAFLESPREVIARLAITVVSTASGPPAVGPAGEPPRAGQEVVVRFGNLPGDGSDWVAIAPAGRPDSEWGDWAYTGGKTDGEVTLRGQAAGDYELRAYAERPTREVLARAPLTILP